MSTLGNTVGGSAWGVWLRMLLVAVVGNLLLRIVALAVFEIPAEFPPLSMAGPTIFFTVIGVIAAIGVWLLVRRRSARPVRVYRQIAMAALILSLVPDLWLLSDAAADAFPGATVPAVATLMLQHVFAAFVVIGMVSTRT